MVAAAQLLVQAAHSTLGCDLHRSCVAKVCGHSKPQSRRLIALPTLQSILNCNHQDGSQPGTKGSEEQDDGTDLPAVKCLCAVLELAAQRHSLCDVLDCLQDPAEETISAAFQVWAQERLVC